MRNVQIAALLLLCAAAPTSAFAQRFPFERTFEVTGPTRLEVSTDRGKIEVLAGEPGRVVVEGVATVRFGWDVPSNAVEIARQIAAAPPVEHAGSIVRLHVPADRAAQRAVTVSYRVRVPPGTDVRSTSQSGETHIQGTAAAVEVRTQSGAIDIEDLSGPVQVSTGSGAVKADGISGGLSVTTSSSGFNGTRLGSSLRVRTQSGGVAAQLEGSGNVDVETGSSAINVRGIRGALAVKTQSGSVTVQGVPVGDWSATTGSSSVSLQLESSASFVLDAASRSGSVTVEGASLAGEMTKRTAKGSVGKGGPTVLVRTGSGAIRVQRRLPV